MLESLKDAGVLEVKVKGEALVSFLQKKPCVYFEWHYGEKAGAEWQSYCTGYRTEKTLEIIAPGGAFELPVNKLRPHIAPSLEKTYTGKDIAEAPGVVKEYFTESTKPVSVEEYCIEPGKAYYAKVEVEEYNLPPGEDGEPQVRHNCVLALSDLPFKEGRPQRPLTPGYRGWSY